MLLFLGSNYFVSWKVNKLVHVTVNTNRNFSPLYIYNLLRSNVNKVPVFIVVLYSPSYTSKNFNTCFFSLFEYFLYSEFDLTSKNRKCKQDKRKRFALYDNIICYSFFFNFIMHLSHFQLHITFINIYSSLVSLHIFVLFYCAKRKYRAGINWKTKCDDLVFKRCLHIV